MSKFLLVGDFHAEPRDLEDCQALADYIYDIARKEMVPVVFLGDQYHTHAIIHAEVQRFWYDFYKKLSKGMGSFSLVGNHDKPGSQDTQASAMLAHEADTIVITRPTVYSDILFLPYMHTAEEFIRACNSHEWTPTVICHQTFDGSRFENGVFAPDGIDPNLIRQQQIISGHIHSPQEFGKVWYVGAPRWRTLSDANVGRAIWLVEIENGVITSKTAYDTGKVCRQIFHLEDKEGAEAPERLDSRHDWRIDIYGTAERIEKRSEVYRGKNVKVRTFRTVNAAPSVKESEGVDKAFEKWVDAYQPQWGTPVPDLKKLLKERTGRAF